nr:unnamed protein product [Haemonchus contortus]
MERYGYRRNFTPRTPYQKYRRDKTDRPRSPCFLCGHEGYWRDECQTGNELMASGAIERVPRNLSSGLMIHPLSVAEDRSAREYHTASKTNSKDLDYSKRKKKVFVISISTGRTEKAISILKPPSGESTILRYQDEDKKRSRTMSTSVAEAQSRSGAHSRQGSMLFGQQVLGQDIPCGTGDDYEVTRTTLFMMSSSENQQSRTTVGGSRYTV